MNDANLVILLNSIAQALTTYAGTLTAQPEPLTTYPDQTPVQVAAAPAATAPVQPEPEPAPTAAPDPAAMTAEAFAIEAAGVLHRHGGDQAPLLPLMAAWNVSAPVTELRPDQYRPFLAQLRQAYGEV